MGLRERAEGLIQQQIGDPHACSPEEVQSLLHELEVYQIELEMQNLELRETQQRLEESRDRYADLYDFAPLGYVTLDTTGCIREANMAAAKLLSKERKFLIGMPLSVFVSVEHKSRLRDHLAMCARGLDKVTTELTLLPSGRNQSEDEGSAEEGAPVVIDLYSIPVNDAEGGGMLFRTAITDVTERKRSEAALKRREDELRQSQKMEAIGRLAGGIAHDFNNLLTAISGYSEMLMNTLDRNDPRWADAAAIHDAGRRAAILVSGLSAFSRKQPLNPKVFDLHGELAAMNALLQRTIGEDIDLVLVANPNHGRVKADPVRIQQVVLNLAVNARDAMPEGGSLTIETDNVDLDGSPAQADIDLAPGRYVTLTVRDTGCGMSKDVMSQLFEPFFTTKEVGKGTGLGLSMAYGIVKQSGGDIRVTSEPGRGSTFKIFLPRVDEAVDAKEAEEVTVGSPQGTETILVVEDEDAVRKLVCGILRHGGYTVLDTRNGDDALVLCQKHNARIHLMITDVVMPHMSGRELHKRIEELCPEMRVLYISGYPEHPAAREGGRPTDADFLPKPFSASSLTSRVREILDRPKHG